MKRIKIAAFILLAVIALIALGIGWLYFNGLSGVAPKKEDPKDGQIKVACVGDSITYGHGISNWPENNYPAVLQRLLGDGYHVQNFGVSGRAVQDASDQPYRAVQQYADSIAYDADILIFMMGSNDTKPENWFGEDAFKTALLDLLDDYTQNGKTPLIYVCTTPSCFFMDDSTGELTSFDLRPAYADMASEITRSTAEALGYPVIDIHGITKGNPAWFAKDGVHPSNEGAAAIAEAVADAILQSGQQE